MSARINYNNVRLLIAITLLLTFTHISWGQSANDSRPNIIFIMSDDHTTQAIGAYGSRLAKLNPTPTLDKMAAEGMRFDNVFVTNSICTPSRATLWTGQYSKTNGAYIIGDSLPPAKQYLPRELRKRGYQTAIIGKWHLQKEPAAFDYYEVLPDQGRYFDPRFRKMGAGDWPNNWTSYEGHSTDVITDLSMDWLESRSEDRPFFLALQYKAPHEPWSYAKRYSDYLKNSEIPEPSSMYYNVDNGSIATRGVNDSLRSLIGSSISRRNEKRRIEGWLNINIDSTVTDLEYTHQAYQQYLIQYLRTVKGIDDNLARFFDYLQESGLMENTVIIYTGDQGMMLGEHDYWDKRWMYEESMRMPFIVRYPKMVDSGSVSDALINNTDFAPTLIDLAGGTAPDYMQGKSFTSVLETGEEPEEWRSATYYRYWEHMSYHGVPAHFGVRTKRYKLIFFYGRHYDLSKMGKTAWRFPVVQTPVAWEFYDLKKDPEEMNNQYDDPAYDDIISQLKEELKRQREKYNIGDEDNPQIQQVIEENWDIP